MRANSRRGPLNCARGHREPRRRCRLGHARDLDERLARRIVRMFRRFIQIKHRGETNISSRHDCGPLSLRLAGDDRGQFVVQIRPCCAVVLGLEGRIGDASFFEQKGIELRFDLADRDPLTVRALVGVVEVRAAIEHV